MDDMPTWMADLAGQVRAVKMPTAQLADAMRACGEDPRNDVLWGVRIDQLDTVLFGRPARELRTENRA